MLAVNFDEQGCELITRFPQCRMSVYSTNSFCIKQGDFIFCIPYGEKNIGYYNLSKKVWGTIEIGFEKRLIYCPDQYDECNGRIWLIEYRGKKIYQINLKNRVLEKQYCILSDQECLDGEYVSVGMNLYCLAGNCIYRIDVINSEIVRYQVLNTEDIIYTICYDGCNFWLSGNRRAIYIWNPDHGIINVIDQLEKIGNFSLGENIIKKNFPIFLHSVVMGFCIWFIPLQANMPIIYIDRKSYKINVFEIAEEEESEESLTSRGSGFKYYFLYIRQDRYIGLLSQKNQVVWELDTVELCVEKKECFSKQSFEAVLDEYYDGKMILYEGNLVDESVYSIMVQYDMKSNAKQQGKAGSRIYHGI